MCGIVGYVGSKQAATKSVFSLCFLIAFALLSSSCAANSSSEIGKPDAGVASADSATVETSPVDCKEFQSLIDKTYTFKPTKLSATQQTAKSAEMDIVWEKVKADKKLIPCLVAGLESPAANAFFRFDGSTLLYSLDKSDDTKKLLIRSYAATDLEDMTLQHWIRPILRLGMEEFDTSKAGEAWLQAKDPHYYLPEHATLKVDKLVGSLAIFGSMDERFATPALTQIASSTKHPGREIAATLLAMQATPEAMQALTNLDQTGLSASVRSSIKGALSKPTFVEKRIGEPKISRSEYVKAFTEIVDGKPTTFMELVSRVPDGEKDAVAVLLPEDIPLVRKARRFFASTGTPHMPEWYQSFTDILMEMQRPAVSKPAAGEN